MVTFRVVFLSVAVLLGVVTGEARSEDVFRSAGVWRDDRAMAFPLEALHGTPAVLTMAYGACRRVCSTSLRLLEQLQSLADAKRIALNFVVVGIDPSQDHPADWAEYRALRKLDRHNWQFLTGDEDSVRRLANLIGVRYWRYGEHTMHDFKIVLLAPDGHVLRSAQHFDDDLTLLLP